MCSNLRLLLLAIATFMSQPALGVTDARAASIPPPPTPEGLPVCETPLLPAAGTPRALGERFEYSVEVIGVSLGLVHIETTRKGVFEGQSVTEFRGWIDPDPAVSALVSLDGRAFALVPDAGFTPLRATVRYHFRGDSVAEDQMHSTDGQKVRSSFEKNGEKTTADRDFPSPVHDFLSGFLMLRRLPRDARGCAVILGNDKAYTVWIEPQGIEALDTGHGMASFDRYLLKYGSDKTHAVRDIMVWISTGSERIPYQAKGLTSYSPVVKLAGYRKGRS